jgi:DNA-binding MarR family transcriptional regulator
MTKIIIEKNDLESIINNISSLLKTGDKSFSIPTLKPIHETYDLDEKEQLVINYLNKNPGHTKEQVVSGCRRYSRGPILKAINGLLERGFIIKGQNSNSKKRIYALYVNYQDIVISLREDLKLFEHFYSELIDHARPIIMGSLTNYKTKKSEFDDLIEAIIGPYKYLCMMYIVSDLLLWNIRPLDNDTLYRKFAMLFETVKKIHLELVKIIPADKSELMVRQLLFDRSYGFNEFHIMRILTTFKEYGLGQDAEAVVDILWKISYPILPMIYPSRYEKRFKDGTLKDWRKLLEDRPESKYKPKTDMLSMFDK